MQALAHITVQIVQIMLVEAKQQLNLIKQKLLEALEKDVNLIQDAKQILEAKVANSFQRKRESINCLFF